MTHINPPAPSRRAAAISPVHPRDAPDEERPLPDFLPWFPQRRARNGWTPDRQRDFLAALQRTGSVPAAAAAVGKSARSAWQLRVKPGAEHFAVVWDQMVRNGIEQVVGANFERAMHGEIVPVFRRGRYRGFTLRYPDRTAIALLEAGRRGDRPLSDERDRLEKWAIALRRRELDLDGDPHSRGVLAAEAHALWVREIADEKRRVARAEVRARLRTAARCRTIGPRIRAL